MLPGRAKGLVVVCHEWPCLSIEKGRTSTMQGFGDNFILVIPLEDDKLHTDEHPFCPDDTCFCHENQELVNSVQVAVYEGLLTLDEATAFIQGRTI